MSENNNLPIDLIDYSVPADDRNNVVRITTNSSGWSIAAWCFLMVLVLGLIGWNIYLTVRVNDNTDWIDQLYFSDAYYEDDEYGYDSEYGWEYAVDEEVGYTGWRGTVIDDKSYLTTALVEPVWHVIRYGLEKFEENGYSFKVIPVNSSSDCVLFRVEESISKNTTKTTGNNRQSSTESAAMSEFDPNQVNNLVIAPKERLYLVAAKGSSYLWKIDEILFKQMMISNINGGLDDDSRWKLDSMGAVCSSGDGGEEFLQGAFEDYISGS